MVEKCQSSPNNTLGKKNFVLRENHHTFHLINLFTSGLSLRDPVTIPMVNCQFDVINQQFFPGKRVAVFGLHIFELEKIREYEQTGKSDYFIVPIIGETSTFVL